MSIDTIFKRILSLKTISLLLIILWGFYVQTSNNPNGSLNSVTDIGGIIFAIFSVAYLASTYLLYKFVLLGKQLFPPLVVLFMILGFFTELIAPSQYSKDLFYLIIFYIVSPIFFVAQGVILSLLYFTELKNRF